MAVDPVDLSRYRAQIREHWLFEGLDDASRDAVMAHAEGVRLRSFRILVREGDDADGMYLVLAGRLRAQVARAAGAQVLGEIGPGELIGEVAVLHGGARMATVLAVRDSVLAFFPTGTVEAMAEQAPALWRRIGSFAVRRAQRQVRPSSSLCLALWPMEESLSLDWLASAAADALAPFGSTCVLTAQDHEAADPDRRAELIADRELAFDRVLLVADFAESAWTRACLRHADRVVRVGDGGQAPLAMVRAGVETLISGDASTTATQHLLLLQPPEVHVASGTAAWLERHPVDSHHHVRRGNADDAGRAARLLCGLGIGVAFGGASSRGVAHVGVIRAFQELGVPIDTVSGCSSGVGAALGVAMSLSPDTIRDGYLQVLDGLRPTWRRWVPPFVAAMSGHAAAEAMRATFGEVCLEDLLIPAAVATVDLRHHRVRYLTMGPAWLAARATTSLPGFWPPVIVGDQVLVDGGIADNSPTEVLRVGCDAGLLLAIDLFPPPDAYRPFADVPSYGHELSGWSILWQKLLPWRRPSPYPPLFELLILLVVLPNTLRQLQRGPSTAEGGVHYLTPPIGSYGFFEVGPAEAALLDREAADYTREQLAALWARSPRSVAPQG